MIPFLMVTVTSTPGDDDVASIIGINCPRLESLVITGTNVTNSGLSWFLCCR